MKHLLRAMTAALLLASTASAQPVRFADVAMKANPARTAPPLTFEKVGENTGRPWVTPLATRRIGETDQWRHLFYFKKQGKNERVSWPVTLNLNTGEIKEHPSIPGLETWKTAWHDGKLYLGQNLPGHIIVYDPVADTFTDLGHAFEAAGTVFRLAITPDGKIAIAGNGPAEMSVLDPQTRTFTKYGKISTTNTYCYELGVAGDYIYGATRGKAPWELVAINRKTGERSVIANAPTEGYLNISGNVAGIRQSNDDPFKQYTMEGTTLTPVTQTPAAAKPPTAAAAVVEPKVFHDESTAYLPGGRFTIHYQSPADMSWKAATIDAPMGGSSLEVAVSLPDGRIIAAAGAYVPVILVDPKTGETRKFPLAHLSIRSALLHEGKLFLTGYPSASVYMLDINKPVTPTQDTPLVKAVPEESVDANPRLLTRYPMTNHSGGHIGIGLFPGPDGRVYLCTRRHRHHRGFSMAWFDPDTADQAKVASGEVDTGTAFDHLQIGGIAPTLDGSKLLISTYVEGNNQIPGTPPEAAKLFVLDLATQKIVATYQPVSDSTCLTGIAEVAPGKAVGLALDKDRVNSILYRIDLASGAIEQSAGYKVALMAIPGVSSVPVKGPEFLLGPDGMIWTSVGAGADRTVFLRIDPATLALHPVGLEMQNSHGMVFHQGELYMVGAGHLRRMVLPADIKLSAGR